jgi:hypothetical protein
MAYSDAISRHSTPQLQVPLVARLRNHRYLQREGLGFWGPLALYGRAEHGGEISLQFDSERAVGWRHDDGVDQPPERLRGFGAGFWTFQGLSQRLSLLAVELGHLGVKKRRRFVGRLKLRLQLLSAGVERLDLGLTLVHRDFVVQYQVQELLDPCADPLDFAFHSVALVPRCSPFCSPAGASRAVPRSRPLRNG